MEHVKPCAFEGQSVKILDLPNVKTVGKWAFRDCMYLMQVVMLGVLHVGKEAFANCSKLERVKMPQLVHVGEGAFDGCQNLKRVDMLQLSHLEARAFVGCWKLKRVDMPQLAHVGTKAFYDCDNLERVDMPQLSHVGAYAFLACEKLERVDMPQLAHVGKKAFCNCKKLESAILPITAEIHPDAFSGCDPARLVIRFLGVLAADDLDRPNAFPVLNQYARTATVAHQLDGEAADTVVVAHTWPASTDQLTAGDYRIATTHAGTARGPATAVVDSTGIVSPIPLQDLGGNQFPVHGCWSDGPGADFKALAAAQHPEALGDPAAWAVLVGDEAEEPSETVDLADAALRLANGEFTLGEPWLLVWMPVEGDEGV